MKGARHWLWQRITAVLLIPLTLWFMFAFIARVFDSQYAAINWLSEPTVAIAAVVYLAILFWHSQLGLQVIIEDYVSSTSRRYATLIATKFINIIAAAIAIFAVLRIAL